MYAKLNTENFLLQPHVKIQRNRFIVRNEYFRPYNTCRYTFSCNIVADVCSIISNFARIIHVDWTIYNYFIGWWCMQASHFFSTCDLMSANNDSSDAYKLVQTERTYRSDWAREVESKLKWALKSIQAEWSDSHCLTSRSRTRYIIPIVSIMIIIIVFVENWKVSFSFCSIHKSV